MGRIVILAALFSLMVAASAPAQNRDQPSDVSAMKVAKIDLQAALNYENMALASAKAHHQLINAHGALYDMDDAVKEPTPDESWANEYEQVTHKREPRTHFGGHWLGLLYADSSAEDKTESDLVASLEASNATKNEMLAFVTRRSTTAASSSSTSGPDRGERSAAGPFTADGHSLLRRPDRRARPRNPQCGLDAG